MIEILLKYKIYLLIGGAALLVFLGYRMFFSGEESPNVAVQNTVDPEVAAVNAERLRVEQELLTQLLELRSITLDDRVFSSPVFISLEDFSQPLEEQPVGRPNPFAPIAVTPPPATAVSTTTATSSDIETLE